MKNVFLLLTVAVLAVSCGSGKDNKVNSGSTSTTSGTSGLETGSSSEAVNFEGSYDIRRDSLNVNCPASINIVRSCNGYVLSSNITDRTEDFCNVNKGEIRRVVGNPSDRNPPNPDRNPPNPDGSVVVTQQANELKAVVRIGQNVYTNSLRLDNNVYLTKVTDYKSRGNTRCLFQKR